jgi:hypothetical protein
MSIKVLFDPSTGKLLGAQIVGQEGVDNRINVLATAIQAGMTVFDLEEIELAYAPQFGSAKDPINMVGFVASNVIRGDHPQVHVDDWDCGMAGDSALIDVRTAPEFVSGQIPGSDQHTPGRAARPPQRGSARSSRRRLLSGGDARLHGRSRRPACGGRRREPGRRIQDLSTVSSRG